MILKVRLKEILAERGGMTQIELKEKTGLRANAISEIANNMRSTINREHIGEIAKALNITDMNELFYFEKE